MKNLPRSKRAPNRLAILAVILIALVGVLYVVYQPNTLQSIGQFIGLQKPTPKFSADQTQKMDTLVTQVMDQYHIPGVIAAVWVPNKGTWVKGFGYADTATNQAMDPNMTFRIASLTKTFTASVLLQLVDEGKVHLDDPVSNYVTDPTIPNGNKITIRQLANMTSGLFDYSADPTFDAIRLRNPLQNFSAKDLVSFAFKHRPNFAPGKEYAYCNTNYIILGMVIEKVTGNSLGTEIQNRIITPLNLTHTSYATATTMPAGSSHGYSLSAADMKTTIDSTVINPSWGGAAGAVISNIYDLKTWIQEVDKGTLLSPAAQKERLTWVNEPGSPLAGYGIGVMKIGKFVGHEGHIDGFNSLMMYEPSTGATVIVMQNFNPNGTMGIAGNIAVMLSQIVTPELWK